jgi:hypothetical protein
MCKEKRMLFQAQGLLATGHCCSGCFCEIFVINAPVLAEDKSDDTIDSFYEELW